MRYEDYRRRKNARRARGRSSVTTVLAVVVIIAALIAIAVVIISLIPKNTAPAPAQAGATETAQPTLYIPDRQDSAAPTAPPTDAPQTPSYAAPTEPGAETPTEPDTPAEPNNIPASGTGVETEGALHYFVSGGTDEGYNWTYSSDGATVDITCKYHFDTGQYEFIVTGVSPGVTDITLVYYTDNNTSVDVPMTVSVDESLKVTRIG